MYDDFKIALKRAAPYLEYKEYIFAQEGVPKEVARLPFVESMFLDSAKSHVGAVGMWQFMPYTGKQFMRISSYIDERRSPLKAALAAARLLKANYQDLGTWPLAITAYNHGPGGMARAKRVHGTSDLGYLIKNYKGKAFGFASKNFYGELLAVQDVFAQNQGLYRQYSSAFGKKLDAIALSQPMTISQVLDATGLERVEFRKYNPDFLKPAFKKYRKKTLPQGFVIVLPREKIVAFKRSAKEILLKIASNKQKNGRG
jgi:membrane-bound lytic murein transglycosylase D